MKDQEKELRDKMMATNQRMLEFEMKENSFEDQIFSLSKENSELKNDIDHLLQREQAYKKELSKYKCLTY